MVITLTPQWRAILPLLVAALLCVIFAAVIAGAMAIDRMRMRDLARFRELVRSRDERDDEEATL